FALNEGWAGNWSYTLCGIFGGLAFLVKQPGFAAPLSVLAVLLMRKKVREAACVALGAAFPVILLFGVLWLRHESFMHEFLLVSKGVWSLADGVHFAIQKLDNAIVLVPLAIGAVGFACALRAEERSPLIPW